MSQQSLRQSVVSHQLDDLSALGDALTMAARDGDTEQLASLRATLDRFVLAMGWSADAALPSILAYAREHEGFGEDLFGPAFILNAIAPERPETATLLARLPPAIRDLLALVTPRRPPRP